MNKDLANKENPQRKTYHRLYVTFFTLDAIEDTLSKVAAVL